MLRSFHIIQTLMSQITWRKEHRDFRLLVEKINSWWFGPSNPIHDRSKGQREPKEVHDRNRCWASSIWPQPDTHTNTPLGREHRDLSNLISYVVYLEASVKRRWKPLAEPVYAKWDSNLTEPANSPEMSAYHKHPNIIFLIIILCGNNLEFNQKVSKI